MLHSLNEEEKLIIKDIEEKREKFNLDNISRTDAYLQYYHQHPEIQWSFLAHMVSRNAGWNMCDLKGDMLPNMIFKKKREEIFIAYERANWIIFQDAFPQLMIYHFSKRKGRPLFHLLKFFHVSSFMEKEWNNYWVHKNGERLIKAQIINEQQVIEKPVVNHPYFKRNVFQTLLFSFQDYFHFSNVLFPTLEGELYGGNAGGFRSVHKRITLGKRLANILFAEKLYPSFFRIANETVHTGSRLDYEQYMGETVQRTPPLRSVYPIISHRNTDGTDWSFTKNIKEEWFRDVPMNYKDIHLTNWYMKKKRQLKLIMKALKPITHYK